MKSNEVIITMYSRLDPRPENQKTSSCHNWYKHKHIGTFKRGSGYGRKLRFSRLGALEM